MFKDLYDELKDKPFHQTVNIINLILSWLLVVIGIFVKFDISLPVNMDKIMDFCSQLSVFYKIEYFIAYIIVALILIILQIDGKKVHIKSFPFYYFENDNEKQVVAGGIKETIDDVLIVVKVILRILFTLYIIYLYLSKNSINEWGIALIILSFVFIVASFLQKRYLINAHMYRKIIEDLDNLSKGKVEKVFKEENE